MTPPEAQSQEPLPPRLGAVLQTLGGAAAILIGGLYSIGLVIVNANLAQYGFISHDLARPEYVMAGALWFALTVGVWGAVEKGRSRVSQHREQRHYVRMLLSAVLSPMLSLGILFFMLASLANLTNVSWNIGAPLLALLWNGVTIELLWVNAVQIARGGRFLPGVLFDIDRHRHFRVTRLVLLFATLTGILLYAAFVYPLIPAQIGGGRKPIVRLVLSIEAERWIKTHYVFHPPSTDTETGPFALLMESDAYFYVTPAREDSVKRGWYTPDPFSVSGPAIGIDKKLVSVIAYAERVK